MIELNNVSKTYTNGSQVVHALKNANLHIPKGAIHGVIGLSGAGKSTLIRCVNLLERPTEGSVMVDGQDITRLSAAQLNQARHRIGMIFQHFNLLTTRNVFDNVAFPLELTGQSKQAIKERVEPLLKLVGLADKASQFPAQLSGGQKQRVAIARALATHSRVVLADEPTANLDRETGRSILELMQNINRSAGTTFIFSTHDPHVMAMADRLVHMEDGRILAMEGARETAAELAGAAQ